MEPIRPHDPVDFNDAMQLEKQGELATARRLYEKLLRGSPHKIKILERLIIVARKLKDTEAEVSYIDDAINIHQKQYPQAEHKDAKLTTISTKLNKLLGHVDKRGKVILMPPEVVKLEQRKQRLLSKKSTRKKKK